MTEYYKLDMESVAEYVYGTEKMGTLQTNSTNNSFQQQQHRKENSDSFVLDIENFSHAADRNTAQNSRIKLQRNLSRKGSNKEKKPNSNGTTANEKDNPNIGATTHTHSPRAPLGGDNTPESLVTVVMGTTDLLSSNSQAQHQITVTAGNGNISGSNADQSKYAFRRNSFRRPSSSSSWTIDPRRVLFFFATFSSMGTIMLIYFTLTLRKHEGNQDWFQ